jgi:SAM-dependent methyltransferase
MTGVQPTEVLPLPPMELRAWVGPTDAARYDNPGGALVYAHIPIDNYRSVLDFGCGCGRVARQLILQYPRPQSYVGFDVHPGAIAWASENLAPAAPGFSFVHLDINDPLVNPDVDKPDVLPFPVPDESVTLVDALSIFTHIVERDLPYYLGEVARVLHPDGLVNASFFLFEKSDFPALGPQHNALYGDASYPKSAVFYDRSWLELTLEDCGLGVVEIAQRPEVRGYQWLFVLGHRNGDREILALPRDDGERGVPRDLAGSSPMSTAS